MPTNNKTTHYNLNSWLGTDKPTRSDFVSDNTLIDTALYNHENNSTLHMTASEKAFVAQPFYTSGYPGTGASTYQITFSFTPKAVFLFRKNKPLSYYDSTNGYTIINAGFTFPSNCGSSGMSLVGSTLTVTQSTTAENGIFINLNELYGQYHYIAFK